MNKEKPIIENCDVKDISNSRKCYKCDYEDTCPLHKEIVKKMYEAFEKEVAEYGD